MFATAAAYSETFLVKALIDEIDGFAKIPALGLAADGGGIVYRVATALLLLVPARPVISLAVVLRLRIFLREGVGFPLEKNRKRSLRGQHSFELTLRRPH